MVNVKHKVSSVSVGLLRDIVLWIVSCVLFGSAIYFGLYCQGYSRVIKVFINILAVVISFGCIGFTVYGRRFLRFFVEAKAELQKVVWPSRDETLKVTFIVSFLVFAASVILWLIDFCLLKVIYLFTK